MRIKKKLNLNEEFLKLTELVQYNVATSDFLSVFPQVASLFLSIIHLPEFGRTPSSAG